MWWVPKKEIPSFTWAKNGGKRGPTERGGRGVVENTGGVSGGNKLHEGC